MPRKIKVKPHKLEGLYLGDNRILLTKNLVPGQKVYTERLFKVKGEEYREWIVNRSKLAAAVKKGLKTWPFKRGIKVLYLGIAAGTTASHISDLIGKEGVIFGVEFAPRVLRELMFVVNERRNIIPILADANQPETYQHIASLVDVVYQDVAQPHQVEIFLKNLRWFSKPNTIGFLAVKARSIDVTKDPKEVFKMVEKQLRENKVKILEAIRLDPFHKDHMMFVVKVTDEFLNKA